MIKVVLLGAGNVGTHLFRVLHKAENISLIQWYNRSAQSLEEGKGKVKTLTQLDELVPEADLYLLSVSDDNIPELSSKLKSCKGIIAHTAGSVSMETLNQCKDHGVFYPLQTFSKQKKVDFEQVPLCLEANTEENFTLLKKVAIALGGPTHKIDSTQRKALHIAAVFVNNFVNHMYAVGEQLCQEHQVPFSILQPLIAETADKIKSLSPKAAQTGPALRGDQQVLKDHLSLLTKTTQKELYQLISTAIQQDE